MTYFRGGSRGSEKLKWLAQSHTARREWIPCQAGWPCNCVFIMVRGLSYHHFISCSQQVNSFLMSFCFFLAVLGLHCWVVKIPLVAVRRGYSSLQRAGFSLRWLLLMWSPGSRVLELLQCGSWAPQHRLNSCGEWAWLPHSLRDLPRSGIKPVCPELADGFFTTEPPGKPKLIL